ncbi:DUF5954 family protein [Streptomyces sp. NPDC093795]|uniref:DUF5954 family protein n=1 Tax=Streptomyces sp. NPDC093795 TaxID=3366051 RepID=UPI0037FC4E20
MEADAADAAVSHSDLVVRGPLFGVAAQSEDDGPRWRVVVEVTNGCPQQARDGLNSLLWFRAKDDAKSPAERRALLAAVARLEKEYVDELTVLDTRYRVVRAEEYAAADAYGDLETPRPTDPEPLTPDWSPGSGALSPRVDDGLVLDPDAPLSPLQAAERLSLRSLAYTGARFPDAVLHDSARALESHPDVMLMPAAFLIVERSGAEPWTPGSGLQATAHDARRTLAFSLSWWEPRQRGLIPFDAEPDVDARTVVAENTSPAAVELAVFAEATERLRAGNLNQVEVHGTVSRIARARRLLRWGHDGPEGPRPSDINTHGPQALHPRLDEHGTVHFEEPTEDETAP